MNKTFSERVIEAALSIPSGSVTTYGDIARVCGGGGQAARSISGILGRAQKKGVAGIPWHRIVYSGGKAWLPDQYSEQRRSLCQAEGIEINDRGYVLDFEFKKHLF